MRVLSGCTLLHSILQQIDKFYRNSQQESSLRKGVLKNCAIVKELCWILFLGAQLEGGGEGGLTCLFQKLEKTCPNSGEKYLRSSIGEISHLKCNF